MPFRNSPRSQCSISRKFPVPAASGYPHLPRRHPCVALRRPAVGVKTYRAFRSGPRKRLRFDNTTVPFDMQAYRSTSILTLLERCTNSYTHIRWPFRRSPDSAAGLDLFQSSSIAFDLGADVLRARPPDKRVGRRCFQCLEARAGQTAPELIIEFHIRYPEKYSLRNLSALQRRARVWRREAVQRSI
jgi:hypothetical protein